MHRRIRKPGLRPGSTAASTAAASFLAGLFALTSVAAAAPEWWNIVEKHQDAAHSTTSTIAGMSTAITAASFRSPLDSKGMVADLVRRSEPGQIANRPGAKKPAVEHKTLASTTQPADITKQFSPVKAEQTGLKAAAPTAQAKLNGLPGGKQLKPQQQATRQPESSQDTAAKTAISSWKHRKRRLKIARLDAVQLPLRNPRRVTAPQQAAKALKLATASAVRTLPTLATTTQAQPQNANTEKAEAKPLPIKIEPTLKINVNLSAQRMHVYADGKLKHTWKISSGLMRWRTPNGNYKPTWMSRMHYSKQWGGAPMPHSIFFHNGYAIHATYAVRALGRPASHGCVRLSPRNARTLFRMVNRHSKAATKIAVVGKTPVYKPRRSKTRVVRRKVKPRQRARKRRNQRVAYAAPRRAKARPRKKVRRYRAKKKVFWPF